ncbi:uncharacterized protein [Diadema antillarum]|uniref:uncharacterized protein n=1 Tax=Diadema antillarum TaxID=105358 RepID=UPI003A85AF90
MSMYNAVPGLVIQQNYSISGKAIHVRLNGTDDCVDFGDFSGRCCSDPSLCSLGFSFSFWMRLTEDEIKESGPVYIVSSGIPDARGFGVFRETRSVTVVVNDGTNSYTVELDNLIPADLWKNLGFTWSPTYGLTVVLDAAVVGRDSAGSANALSDVINRVTLGCRYNGAAFTSHSSGMFDEVVLFPLWFNQTFEFIWLMGGWDEDNCVVEPCVEGDCYDTGFDSYRCDCFPGYNETLCDMEIDECESYPCLNGGTCSDWVAYYTCECAFGYTGDSCEKDLSPNYDYSNVKSLQPQFLLITPEINPLYVLADYYLPLNNLGDLDTFGSNVSVTLGRTSLGYYPDIRSADSYVEIANFTNQCLSEPNVCPYGLTLAFWMKIDGRVNNTGSGLVFSTAGPINSERVGIRISLTSAPTMVFEVNTPRRHRSMTIPKASLLLREWMHFGLSWSKDGGMALYLNGRSITPSASTSQSISATNTYDTMTLGSMFGSLDSAAPIAFNDLVVWGRAIRSYERHILLGMTRRELAMIEATDHYWSSDGYIRRDLLTMSDYDAVYAANLHSMDRAGDADVILGHGRDEKGSSIMVIGDGEGWLFLGDFAGTCLSNTHRCDNGLSVSMWTRLSLVADNDTHFLVSSGEQVTRGFSIFQRDVDRLGAAVTNGYRRWVVEIVHEPYIQYEDNMTLNAAPDMDFVGEWTNLGLTWKEDEGLTFFVDGLVVARDPVGYQRFRTSDYETRLILGRRNDFLGHASNSSFEELAVNEQKVEPYEYRENFALLDNLEYKDALYYWNTPDLISSTLKVLTHHSPLPGLVVNGTVYPRSGYLGPTNDVTLVDDSTVDLPGFPDFITLGNFEDTFICHPRRAKRGMSVSFWVKLEFDRPPPAPVGNATAAPYNPEKKYLLSSGGQGASKGFNVYVRGETINVVVDDGSTMTLKQVSAENIPDSTWTNIAFTWHKSESFLIYINGKVATPIDTVVNVSTCCYGNATHFVVGRGQSEDSEFGTFRIHNLVIWDKYVYPRHAHKLLGIAAGEKYFMDLADFYWPFDAPASLPWPVLGFNGGSALMNDRHYFGRCLYTDGKNDYVQLRDFGSTHCVTNPSQCSNGLVVALWIKLRDIPSGSKCLLTSGADVTGERGVTIGQTVDGIDAVVSDGSTTWVVTKDLSSEYYGVWLYLAVRWERVLGLSMFINGVNVGEQVTGTEDPRSSVQQTELLLGRCSYSADDDGFVEAHFDDVIVILPSSGEDLPDASLLHGDQRCSGYVTPDLHFNLTSAEDGVSLFDTSPVERQAKFGGNSRGVSLWPQYNSKGVVDVGSFRESCLSSPALCRNGVSISFWINVLDFENIFDPMTNPQGKGYLLSSGAQNENSTGISIITNNITTTVEVRTEHRRWKSHFPLSFPEEWTNFALTWNASDGIKVYVNGVFQYDYTPPTTVSLYNSTYNATTSDAPTTTAETTTQPPTTTADFTTNSVNTTNATDDGVTAEVTTPQAILVATTDDETTPIVTTPHSWSPRGNDTYAHLLLGARNDLNEGYLRAEFADLAVWYEVIDMANPLLTKILMGEECHEIVITDNHDELAALEVWTGTIECDYRHLADCTEDLDQFFQVISNEDFDDDTVYEIAKLRLLNYTVSSTYMTVDEMEMTTILLSKALTRTLSSSIDSTYAETDMKDLLDIASNLFDSSRSRRWTTIHQTRRRRGAYSPNSALSLASQLESYLMSMAKYIEGVNGTRSDVNITIVSDNIVVQIERFMADAVVPGSVYTFPNYYDPRIQAFNESWNYPTDYIQLPQNIYDYIPASRKNNGEITMVGILFDTLYEIIPLETMEEELYKDSLKVGSRIMYLRVEPELRKNLYNPIVLQMEHKETLTSKEKAFCVFWDFTVPYTKEGAWSMRGLTMEENNSSFTTCHSDHLTHFAIMFQDKDPVVVSIHDTYLKYITWGGLGISIIAIIFLIIVIVTVPDIRTLRNAIHINMLLSMLFAEITVVVIDFLSNLDWVSCKAVACVMEYFYVGVFSWIIMQSFHLWVEVKNPKDIPFKEKFRYYFLIAWGIPLMVVGVSFARTYNGYGVTEKCWITFEDNALWVFFGTSLGMMLIAALIAIAVHRNSTTKEARRSDLLKSRAASLRATVLAILFMSVTWSLYVVEVYYNHRYIEITYCYTAMHALQGLFLAIFYGLCNPEVRLAFMGADLEMEFSKVEDVSITPEPEESIMLQPLPKPTYVA